MDRSAGEARVPRGRLRVLITAPAHAVGGQAHAARQIVDGFAGDPRVRVTLEASDPQLPPPWRILTSARFIRSIVRPLLYTLRLLFSVRRADIVHVFAAAHSAFYFGAAPAILVARLYGRRVLLNYHDGRAADHLGAAGPLLRWCLRRVAMVVVPSGYLQEIFARHGIQAEVVPNIVEAGKYGCAVRTPLPHRLVSTRSLEALYDVESTLEAFALLSVEYPDLVLDIYGDGPLRAALEARAAALGLTRARFHGAIPHSRMPAALAAGGIMVNSSRVDNMPLFVLEAFAAGLPVVSTPAGGIPWMITDEVNGLLVAPDGPGALAAKVRRLLDDPALANRLVRAGQLAIQAYTWQHAGMGWLRLYDTLARAGTEP